MLAKIKIFILHDREASTQEQKAIFATLCSNVVFTDKSSVKPTDETAIDFLQSIVNSNAVSPLYNWTMARYRSAPSGAEDVEFAITTTASYPLLVKFLALLKTPSLENSTCAFGVYIGDVKKWFSYKDGRLKHGTFTAEKLLTTCMTTEKFMATVFDSIPAANAKNNKDL